MTINTNLSRVQYNGNGVTTAFAFANRVTDAAILKVTRTVIATGADTVLTLNDPGTDGYTVAGVPGASVTVNTVSAPATGTRITIEYNVPLTQLADYVANDPFPAETHEGALDKLTIIAQQQADAIARSMKFPSTSDTALNAILPNAPVDGQWPVWDGATGAMKNIAAVDVGLTPATAFWQAMILLTTALASRTALGAAASGANSDITSLSALTSINGGQIGGVINNVLNGNFDIWQRSISGALATTISYVAADRWAAAMTSSAAGVFSRSTDVPTNSGLRYSGKLQRNNGSALTNPLALYYVSESANAIPLQGKAVVFSFYAKAGANFSASGSSITAKLATGKGTDQASTLVGSWTNEAAQINQSPVLTTSWQLFQYTATLPADITQYYLQLSFTPVGTAGADDSIFITGVDVRPSAVAPTVRETHPFETEFLRVLRYYEKSFPYTVAPAQNAGNIDFTFRYTATIAGASPNYSPTVRFSVPKRTSPTVTLYNYAAANAQIRNIDDAADFTSSSVGNTSENGFTASGTGNAANTVGDRLLFHWTADAEL